MNRWFRYVPNYEVPARLSEGWVKASDMICHHDAHSTYMELPGIEGAREHLAECERELAAAQAQLHLARLAVLHWEDELARTYNGLPSNSSNME